MSKSDSDIDELAEDLEVAKTDGDQVLHLNYKGLHELPRKLITEAQDFNKVTRIYLKRNFLTSLPEDIGRLVNIVELYLHSNKLTSIPDGIQNMKNLESLDVSGNLLKILPAAIGQLLALECLRISNNQLESLPRALGKLQNLKVLEAMNNCLQQLPVEVTQCKSMVQLRLDRNKLHWLPRQICQMSSLEELSASGNFLLCLPMELGGMENLKCVYVDNNPYLHAVPVNVYNQELGFNSCGTEDFHQETSSNLQFVSIPHNETCSKLIYLPSELVSQGNRDNIQVTSLLELAIRAAYITHQQSLCPADLPGTLYDLLQLPVGLCQCCCCPIFTSAYPVVFEGQIRLYSLYRLALCCSLRCVRLASLIVNLPLIHPSSSSLCMALAVIEPD